MHIDADGENNPSSERGAQTHFDQIMKRFKQVTEEVGDGQDGFANRKGGADTKSSLEQVLELKKSEQKMLLDRIKDPERLPTRKQFFDAFPFFEELSRLGDKALFINAWQELALDKKRPIYELFTQEYIQELAGYIEKEIGTLGVEVGGEVRILEVGAGAGTLSRFLRAELENRKQNIQVIATDDGSWEKGQQVVLGEDVERLGHKDALVTYKPHIVLCSWMAPEADLSADFRAQESVKQYILIGPPFDTGTPLTWGITDEELESKRIEYSQLLGVPNLRGRLLHGLVVPRDGEDMRAMDGFIPEVIESLSELQISRSVEIDGSQESKTIVYKRA